MTLRGTTTVRRPDGSASSETTFAAASIDLTKDSDRKYVDTVTGRGKADSRRAWKWYNSLGEVHYGVNRSARVAGYATLHCDIIDPTGKVIGRALEGEKRADSHDAVAARHVRNIYSPYGGVRGLIDRWYGIMKIAADSYLIRVRDENGPDGYVFLSASEIDGASASELAMGGVPARKLRWIMVPQNTWGNNDPFVHEIEPEDFIGRLWIPSRQWTDLADITLNSLDDECDILKRLTKTIKGRISSRFMMAGLWYLPSEITDALVVGVGQQDNVRRTDVLAYLAEAWGKNIREWETAQVAEPILLRGPGEHGDNIKFIKPDLDIVESDMRIREEMANRILFGLDVIKTAVSDSENVSHWSGWQIAGDEIRIAVLPDVDALCWALTRLVLHPQLLADQVPPEIVMTYKVGFDLSAAAVRANQQEDARQTGDRGALAPRVLRQASGFGEDDAPTEDEYVRWLGQQTKNAYLGTWGMPVHDEIDWELAGVKKPGPAPTSPADDPESGPGEGDPGSPDDQDRDTPREERPA